MISTDCTVGSVGRERVSAIANRPEVLPQFFYFRCGIFRSFFLLPVHRLSTLDFRVGSRNILTAAFDLLPVCGSRDKMAAAMRLWRRLRRARGGVAPRVGVLQKIRRAFLV